MMSARTVDAVSNTGGTIYCATWLVSGMSSARMAVDAVSNTGSTIHVVSVLLHVFLTAKPLTKDSMVSV